MTLTSPGTQADTAAVEHQTNPWQDWIGRMQRQSDMVSAAPAAALSATLDRADPELPPGTPCHRCLAMQAHVELI